MNPRRLVFALAVALLLSGAVTLFISHKLGNRSAAVETQKVVAASRAVQSGEVLKAESLTVIDWPKSLMPQGTFTKTEEVVGRSAIYPLSSGQPLLLSQLAAPGSGIGLTVKIPEGMRAVSVRSDEVVGVAGFLFPGSHVDVLVTIKSDKVPNPATEIVLQDAEVLTAGQNTEPDPQGKPQTVNVVTLLLTPQDSEKLVLASSQGSIEFVLRNGADRGQVKAVPIQIASLAGAEPARKEPVVRTGPRAPVKEPYVVETISGDKRTTSQFE
ncbi:MAG: Flp pilus assembly protein CpaB [Candidatus Korobacteraceae bacterium]